MVGTASTKVTTIPSATAIGKHTSATHSAYKARSLQMDPSILQHQGLGHVSQQARRSTPGKHPTNGIY
jgi:hypothetical protein